MYSLEQGVHRPPLAWRIVCTTFNVIAVLGWLVMAVILLTLITGTFDDLLIKLWEATA